MSNTPGGAQASASQQPDPPEKFLLFLFSRWGVVCLCIHWVVQNTKQDPFLIHSSSASHL